MLVSPWSVFFLVSAGVSGLPTSVSVGRPSAPLRQISSNLRRQLPARGRDLICHGRREEEREEQWRIQQEILRRRRNKDDNSAYFKAIGDKRAKLQKDYYAKRVKNIKGKDNLEEWKELNKGKTYKDDYSDEPGYSLPIPIASFGLPKFDNGERFDLRLPYVDQGYVAEDSEDVVGRFLGIFGINKEKAENTEESGSPAPKGGKVSPKRGVPERSPKRGVTGRGKLNKGSADEDVDKPEGFNPFGRLFKK